jgi:MFS family permease
VLASVGLLFAGLVSVVGLAKVLSPVIEDAVARAGAPAAVVGVVEGVAEGAAALFKYLSGRYSDRVGRKPLVGAGYGLAAVGKVIVAAASVWPVLMVGRVVDRIGKGIRGAPRDALLAEQVATPDLGKVFGFHRAADTLGAVIGPLAGLAILAATHDNIALALWIAVIPATLSVALVAFTRDDVSAAEVRRDPQKQAATRAPLPKEYIEVVTVLVVIALANFPDALVLLRVSEIGFSATGVVAVYVVYNLVYALVSYPAGSLSDRWPRSRVYAVGLVCFAIGYIGLGVVNGGWVVFVLMAVYGGFNGFTDGVGKAWISSLVPSGIRGRAQGVFQGLSGGAVLVAGLWAGLLWTSGAGDGVVPLIVAGAIAGLAAIWMLTVGRRLKVAAQVGQAA